MSTSTAVASTFGSVVAARRQAAGSRIALHRPLLARAWQRALEGWAQWRAASRQRAELRALAAFDRRLLEDVGLADKVPPAFTPSWVEFERARW